MCADPLSPHGAMTCGIDMSALRTLNMKELYDLREALHVLGDILEGFNCQPRFGTEDGNQLNGAGVALNMIAEFIASYEQAAANVAAAARPETASAIKWRAWTVLGFHADISDSLAAFSVLAAESARDDAEALKRERTSLRRGL